MTGIQYARATSLRNGDKFNVTAKFQATHPAATSKQGLGFIEALFVVSSAVNAPYA